jgi:hypothetical protein
MATAKKTAPTNVIEEALSATQELVLGAAEQTQTLALKTYQSLLDGAGKLDIPAAPGLGDMYHVRADMFEGMYEFGSALLENQRTFTRKVLEAAASAQN